MDTGLGMELKHNSCQGDHSYYAGSPGDAWSGN